MKKIGMDAQSKLEFKQYWQSLLSRIMKYLRVYTHSKQQLLSPYNKFKMARKLLKKILMAFIIKIMILDYTLTKFNLTLVTS